MIPAHNKYLDKPGEESLAHHRTALTEYISRSRHQTPNNFQEVKTYAQSVHKVDKRRRVFPVLHRQSNLSQGLSRCIFTYPTPLVSHPKPDGTHTLMAGFQPGGRNINLDWRIQSSSFILITAMTQDTCESVRNHCNLCWHICRKITGEEENQDRRHERFYSST